MKKLLLLLAALFCGALLLAVPASAHATLESSSPADGSRLKSAPSSVTLHFDEAVGIGDLGYLHVTNTSGDRVESGTATHPGGDGASVEVTLRSGLGDGTYTASYRVISADSHPVGGTVRFVVGNGPLVASSTGGGSASAAGPSALLEASRWISWGGFALLGGSWLLLTVWPSGRDDRRARTIVWTGWGGAVLGGVLEVLFDGPYAAGQSVTHALDWTLIDATLHSDYGQLHSARLILLGVLAVVLGRIIQPGRDPELIDHAVWPLGLGVAYTFSAAGHAMTTSPAWLSIALDMAHLTAMAVWVGGLAVLSIAILPRRDPDELGYVLPWFSRAAFSSVVVMAATGTYAAWRGIGSWHAVLHTDYGLLISGKVIGFLVLIGLGNLSRRVIQAKVRRPVIAFAMTDDVDVADEADGIDDIATERMRRSVLVEIVIAAVVLALTAVLVSQPRGREALAEQAREPITVSATLGSGKSAEVKVEPGVHGPVSIEVTLGSKAKSVTATAALPSKQLGPIPVPLRTSGGVLWTANAVDLPSAGTWTITLVVTTSEFDAVTTDVKVDLS